MRITFVMPSACPTGGAEEAFCQLLSSTSAKQIVGQVVFLEDGPLVQRVRDWDFESHVVACGRTREVWKWLSAARIIKHHARSHQAQLIFGWMTKGHVYGGLAAWLAGIPAVWYQMGLPENSFLDIANRALPSRAIYACSEFVAREQTVAQPRAQVVPIPLGVDCTRFDPQKLPTVMETRKQLGLPQGSKIIGIVGRLQSWKGMHVLIEAMPKILEQIPDAICLIVGGPYPAEPTYLQTLQKLSQKLGIEGKVLFAGAQKDVPRWVQAMDVFVHASHREPFGIVVVEALALGKAVIATVPGGPEQIIEHGMNGWLCEFGKPDDIARHVRSALSTSTDYAANAIATAERFTQTRFATSVFASLENILKR